ncbi:MFS transporter [Reticulibacter mediterranei]|uniref:MFS transporter n=1 Tax=Reticulibacter mediterranei TaxID=2778369 RepID=A0A8J3IMJ3_9CHLR|nr:MFS transporter [Reticulibacter mediterranei]GHO94339.1 MFS transporter [Reticulibacter mediterranei]
MSTLPDAAHKQERKLPVSLWRQRDYLLFWSGQTISSIGGNISLVAFPLLLLTVTGSPLAAGIAGMLRRLPNLLYLVAGALVDRWNRKYVMLVCDIGRAFSLFSIPLALLLGHLTVWQLYINALIEGTLLVFFSIAHASSLGQVVMKEQLPQAMAQEEVVEGVTNLLGPGLAGPLFALAQMLPFVADAISYAASILTLLLIRTPFQTPCVQQRRRLLVEIREGMVWMWRQPVIRMMNLTNVAAALVTPGSTLVVIVVAQQHGASDAIIGLIFACGGVGAILGSLLAPLTQRFLTVGWAIVLVRWLFALLWPCYALVGQPLLLGAVEFGIGFADPLEDVPYFSYRLSIIPDELRGRVISACRLFTAVSNPFGQFLTGLLLEWYGATPAILFGWIVMLLVALAMTLYKPLRTARYSHTMKSNAL